MSNMSETKNSGLGHSIKVKNVDNTSKEDARSPKNGDQQKSLKKAKGGSSAYLNLVETESNPNLTNSQMDLLSN